MYSRTSIGVHLLFELEEEVPMHKDTNGLEVHLTSEDTLHSGTTWGTQALWYTVVWGTPVHWSWYCYYICTVVIAEGSP
jgi:hypothetical protein